MNFNKHDIIKGINTLLDNIASSIKEGNVVSIQLQLKKLFDELTSLARDKTPEECGWETPSLQECVLSAFTQTSAHSVYEADLKIRANELLTNEEKFAKLEALVKRVCNT